MPTKKEMTEKNAVEFKDGVAAKVLALFKKGVDIVIVEQPKGIVIEDGARCSVFIRGRWTSFNTKLWRFTNWRKITPIDRRVKHCLDAPHDYEQTLRDIRTCFPEITFTEVTTPLPDQ